MDKLIFERGIEDADEYTSYDDEPTRIVFEIKSGMKIEHFRIVCKRLASAIGYEEDDIEKIFGDETLTDEEIEAQVRIRSLIGERNGRIDERDNPTLWSHLFGRNHYAISGSEIEI